MDPNEKTMIAELFGKLRQAEEAAPARDGEAERLIRQSVEAQPAAPYYMAQAILVQEQALRNAQQRLQELEDELQRRPAGGGFLGGLFGAGQQAGGQPRRPQAAAPTGPFNRARAGGPWGGGGQGGGFLAGAAQTAMGVAGGVMLGNMLGGLFGGGEAQAAEPPAEDAYADEPMAAEEDFGGGFGDEEFF